MKRLVMSGAILGAVLSAFSVCADEIRVEHAWARATAPGQSTALVDMVITSDKEAKLDGFSSMACKTAQMHHMSHDNGMMEMREVQTIELPAGKRMALGENGYHLMLIDLLSPLKSGERVPLKLKIRVGGKDRVVDAIADVKPLTATMDEHMQSMDH